MSAHSSTVRRTWTVEMALELYSKPFPELVYEAATVHREHHDPLKVQRATLLSIKTGACPEDCGYCPQSAHYKTSVDRVALLPLDEVKEAAQRARADGATRFCMGAAWRQVRDGAEFDRVLDMARTSVNIFGDASCAAVIARLEGDVAD